jgi:putative ABC transport system ATP-binding protein
VAGALFSFDDVRLVFADTTVLDGITTSIADDGVTVLAGPSGSGKSTLLRLCNRLDAPTSGTVRFRGDDVAGLDPLRLRRQVGMVFQRPTLFPGTVHENLLVAEPALSERAARAALELVGLPHSFLERTGDDLSGGEAQRACIARTLVTRPEALLMDEVTSALDPTHRRGIERLAWRLAEEGTPVVWVTHDLHQAERVADRTIVLDQGRIADERTAERFLSGQIGDEGDRPDDEGGDAACAPAEGEDAACAPAEGEDAACAPAEGEGED